MPKPESHHGPVLPELTLTITKFRVRAHVTLALELPFSRYGICLIKRDDDKNKRNG